MRRLLPYAAGAAGLATLLGSGVAGQGQWRGLAPSIDEPTFVPAARANFLRPGDRVIGVVSGKVSKAYPAMIVAVHHIVNDRMPGGPITVTW